VTKFALAILFAALAVAPIVIAQSEMQENSDSAAAPQADPAAPPGSLWNRLKRRLGAAQRTLRP